MVGGEVWVSSSTLELLHSFSPARRLEELQSGDSETGVFILEAFTALDILLRKVFSQLVWFRELCHLAWEEIRSTVWFGEPVVKLRSLTSRTFTTIIGHPAKYTES